MEEKPKLVKEKWGWCKAVKQGNELNFHCDFRGKCKNKPFVEVYEPLDDVRPELVRIDNVDEWFEKEVKK